MFHNSNVFGSCIIHILYTGCAKIKKKILRQKVKHGIYSRFFSLRNAVCFIILNVFGSCIIHILYTGCAKIRKNNSGAKRLIPLADFPSSPERLLCNNLCLLFCDPQGLSVLSSQQPNLDTIVLRTNSLVATAIPSLSFPHSNHVSHRLVSQHPTIITHSYYSSALETCSNVASATGL